MIVASIATVLAEGVSGSQLLLAVVPIIVSLIGGVFVYLQGKKAAQATAKAESERAAAANRKIDQSAFEGLNRALTGEIERLRTDRAEDEQRHASELAHVKLQLSELDRRCTAQADDLRAIHAWARTVVVIVQRPDVATALEQVHVQIPPPPALDTIERGRD